MDNREGRTPYVAAAVVVSTKDATGKPIPPNPMDKLNVSSSGKMRAGTDACMVTLGEPHSPNGSKL